MGEPEPQTPTSDEESKVLDRIDSSARRILNLRKRPLLVVYYHEPDGSIVRQDSGNIYEEFRARNWSRTRMRPRIDVLLHTLGGNPDAAYKVAQGVRDFAADVTYLVPEYAYSAGTLICSSANEILMGAGATLGPIDVTRASAASEFQLAAIEYYKRFAADCLASAIATLRTSLDDDIENWETQVDSELLVEMVRQVTAIRVGELYRESSVTAHYASRLLTDYMFHGVANGERTARGIAERLLKDFPSHDFELDYHMCAELGLCVDEMDQSLSDATRALVRTLREAGDADVVCQDVGELMGKVLKAPFIRLYEYGGKKSR
jgi:hypothetical protein